MTTGTMSKGARREVEAAEVVERQSPDFSWLVTGSGIWIQVTDAPTNFEAKAAEIVAAGFAREVDEGVAALAQAEPCRRLLNLRARQARAIETIAEQTALIESFKAG